MMVFLQLLLQLRLLLFVLGAYQLLFFSMVRLVWKGRLLLCWSPRTELHMTDGQQQVVKQANTCSQHVSWMSMMHLNTKQNTGRKHTQQTLNEYASTQYN